MCTESHWFSIRVDILSKGDECFPIELYHPHEFTPPWRRDSCERRTKKRSWHPHSFSSFFIGFLWCGRLFWLSVVCTFAFFVVQISYGQWVRYQQHPTMISLETNYGNWMYLYPAVTMCSNYTNADTTIDVVQRWVWTTAEQNVIYFFVTPERQTDVRKKKVWRNAPHDVFVHSLWNISADDDAFAVHKAFAETVATTTWSNLNNFARFANDSEHFKDVDMRRLAFMVRKKHQFSISSTKNCILIDTCVH